MGKLMCGTCRTVFSRFDALKVEYKPKPRKSTRAISSRQERANAKKIGGRVTIASGSTPVDKADVKASDTRMECKSTGKKSFSLKKEDLVKLEGQAIDDEMPVFAVEFRGGPGEPSRNYYVLPEGWYLQLLELHRLDRND